MATTYKFRTFFLLQLATLLYLTTLAPTLSEICNPQDKKALLQIKKELNNPTPLSSWDPHSDCCDTRNPWDGVSCDPTQGNRVYYLHLSDLDLHPHPLQFPPSITNLPFLNYLYINRIPNFTGPIPPTITNLRRLRYMSITDTLLSGTIPDSLAELKNLVTLDLSNSNLCGGIPASLSRLSKLEALTLDGNWLSGSIPDSFGSFGNRFTMLSLASNQLSGEIPASLNLRVVDFSNNRLEGDASMLFGPNKKAQDVNLSRNRLSFDFGKVELSKNLEGLDLSNNRIFGRLPRGLAALKSLNEFNVSFNNLCGEIPKGGNMETFDASSYVHNKCLCGSPLPNCKRF